MNRVFEVLDKTGRRIYLTKERWRHITSPQFQHSYMTNYLEEIKDAIVKPDFIVKNRYDDSKVNYCRYLKEKKQYLLVLGYV